MTTLEDRLRGELARKGQHAKITTAPSVDALAGVAANRHRRNRVGGLAAASVLVAVLFGAALVASQTGQTSAVVAAEGEGQASDAPSVIEEEPSAEGGVAPADLDLAPVDEAPGDATLDEAAEAAADDDAQGVEAEAGEFATRALQADGADIANVETRVSAVDFLGSSGVLITQTGGGFGGLASRFTDSGIEAIGLVSPNGLDWEELALTGVPEGATATALETFAGTHVATFERYVLGERAAWVGTSPDLANWELSGLLEGDFVVARQLLVGPNGVVVLGDMTEPDVWSGPIGGPYVSRDQVPAASIGAAGVVNGEFVVLGSTDELNDVVFRSADGIDWTIEANELSSPDAQGSGIFSFGGSVDAIVFTPLEGTESYVSNDLGVTWTEIEHGGALAGLASETLADNGTTGLLSGLDMLTVVLADGETVWSAEVPGVGDDDRSTLVSVESDRAVVLVETEAALTWVVVSR